MSSAEIKTTMTMRNVHPGGYFWRVARTDREAHLLRFVREAGRIVLVTNAAREANDFAERLTLSGVPVLVATDVANQAAAQTFASDGVSSLVATHDYVVANGPFEAPTAVHLRTSPSVRDYTRRIESVRSPVHVTFVVPEDERRVSSLMSHLASDGGHGVADTVELSRVLDLTDTGEMAIVANARRRFPLRG